MKFRIIHIEYHDFPTSDYQPSPPTTVDVEFSDYYPENHIEYRDGPGEFKIAHYHDNSETRAEETLPFAVPAGRKALVVYKGLIGLVAHREDLERR